MKEDIQNREHIILLLGVFYERALRDEKIGYFFTTVKKIDMAHHLTILADFWEMVLFGGTDYSNNTIEKHMQIHQLSPLRDDHFERWMKLFNETIDTLFEGPVALLAKQRALSISTVMKIKIKQSSASKKFPNDDNT